MPTVGFFVPFPNMVIAAIRTVINYAGMSFHDVILTNRRK
jgi:hypothetical protein